MNRRLLLQIEEYSQLESIYASYIALKEKVAIYGDIAMYRSVKAKIIE